VDRVDVTATYLEPERVIGALRFKEGAGTDRARKVENPPKLKRRGPMQTTTGCWRLMGGENDPARALSLRAIKEE